MLLLEKRGFYLSQTHYKYLQMNSMISGTFLKTSWGSGRLFIWTKGSYEIRWWVWRSSLCESFHFAASFKFSIWKHSKKKRQKKDFDFERLSSMIFISKHQKMIRQHGWVFPYQQEKWRAPYSSSTIHDPIFTTRTRQEDVRSLACVVPSLNNASLSGDRAACICSWCFRNKIIKKPSH